MQQVGFFKGDMAGDPGRGADIKMAFEISDGTGADGCAGDVRSARYDLDVLF